MPKPHVNSEAEILTFEQKTARNCRMQKRYDELLREGKHGHYETMFRVWHEEFELEKRRAIKILCEENPNAA